MVQQLHGILRVKVDERHKKLQRKKSLFGKMTAGGAKTKSHSGSPENKHSNEVHIGPSSLKLQSTDALCASSFTSPSAFCAHLTLKDPFPISGRVMTLWQENVWPSLAQQVSRALQ